MLNILWISLILFTTGPHNPCPGCDSLVARATVLCDTRHLDPRNLSESARLLDQALSQEPRDARALSERSRVCYFQAREKESKQDRLKLYEQGMDYGKKAIVSSPKLAEAHFWYLVNLGTRAKTRGDWEALNAVDEMRREIKEVLKDDPKSTGALDVEANLDYELPSLFGGDLQKSLLDLTEAIQDDPNFTRLYVDLAKVYIKEKDFAKARMCLAKALSIQHPTYPADDALDDRPTALRLLHQIETKTQ